MACAHLHLRVPRDSQGNRSKIYRNHMPQMINSTQYAHLSTKTMEKF